VSRRLSYKSIRQRSAVELSKIRAKQHGSDHENRGTTQDSRRAASLATDLEDNAQPVLFENRLKMMRNQNSPEVATVWRTTYNHVPTAARQLQGLSA
jgi:DNA-binding TFAR19-related protein (PDSD5 family)